ncbi:hypothetical protein K2Z83_20430 [Oscillochloris sp. ZM17-4]|uniref:hypothetical protein n=1 Tax=Oscillochloris sp. ZM17-4 TaxID=2866714 RepID=UPI001C72DA28|nr:hypothetical protein [Oscillochloris sp. ZM17-4]MBX0330039.1 hypothetical protein [Oscillochloris sp. ZM17-4]
MSTLPPTIDETLAMARRLPLRERARLIALIAQDIAAEPVVPAAPTGTAPWEALFATIDQIAASPMLDGGRSATAEATESRR